MTIRELIAELKKFPQNGKVGTAAHDNNEHEVQTVVSCVCPFDERTSEMPSMTKGVVVVLR